MIYIEDHNGVLFVHAHGGDTYQADAKKLAKNIYDAYMVLSATDPRTQVPGVGWHAAPHHFWIYEEGDDQSINISTQLHGYALDTYIGNIFKLPET